MAQLEFLFQDCIDEIVAIRDLAVHFIPLESSAVLSDLISKLEGIRSYGAGRPYQWGIPKNRPLRTITSEGEYERQGTGQHHVRVELTSVWEIEPLGQYSAKHLAHRRFTLSGKASTCTRLFDAENDRELAMWRMEIADDASPGCHFHVQILGESNEGPFPHSLSIPRFPCFLATPPAVFEFVLGEIFQDRWPEEAGRDSAAAFRWRKIQRGRMLSILDWQREQLAAASASPWIQLKRAKPRANLFV